MSVKILEKVQVELTSFILDMTDKVIENKRDFYTENPGKLPEESDVKGIIGKYSNRNSLVSGASGIAALAGPAGMLAVIPEVRELMLNQTRMIYDLGAAHGKQDLLSRDLLLGVLTSATVTGSIGIITVQGSKVLVQKTSTNLLNKVVQIFSAKTAQSASKSMLGRYVPALGAAAIAGWSNYSTRKLGKRATDIFSRDIEFCSNEVSGEYQEPTNSNDNAVDQENTSEGLIENSLPSVNISPLSVETIEKIKIQALVNLMLADGKSHPEEKEFIRNLIESSDLAYDEKVTALETLECRKKFSVDYSQLLNLPEDAVSLLIDLVALSKQDGSIHISEKIYIKQVGRALQLSDEDISELIDSV